MLPLQRDLSESEDTSNSFNDAFNIPDGDDEDSLRILFAGQDASYESMATGPAEVQSGGVIQNPSCRDSTPDHIDHCEISQVDQGVSTMPHHLSGPSSEEHSNQHIIDERELAPLSFRPCLEDSQVAPDSVPDITFPPQRSNLYPGDGASESIFTNSHVPTELNTSIVRWIAVLQAVLKTVLP